MTYRDDTPSLRAECVRLRAIIDGGGAPTPAEVDAHAAAHPLPTPSAASNGATCGEPVALWLCATDDRREGVVVLALATETDDQGPYLMAWSHDYGWCGTGDIRRAWPLDASGCPVVRRVPAEGSAR